VRYSSTKILTDLKEKMVFIGGPRQVGKTTLSLELIGASSKESPAYFNWDDKSDKKKIRNSELSFEEPLIILDEVHKFKKWRGLVKGLFDKRYPKNNFIVTGSARLDYYRFGGDSLQGRYHYHRLHPFSLPELSKTPSKTDLQMLLKFGGFPEPLFKSNERHLRRWQREYFERVIDDDLRDLENVKDIGSIAILADELPNRVGSILSIRNLKEELEVAHQTVESWVQILERLYLCFRIPPFVAKRIRAVKKEKKLYLWDWSQVPDDGSRFENFIASQLLKYCHFLEDTEGYRMELRFIRDIDKREIDFVVIKDKKPLFAVEAKTKEKGLAPSISYFAERTDIPHFYQIHLGSRDQEFPDSRARILPFAKFCQLLEMP